MNQSLVPVNSWSCNLLPDILGWNATWVCNSVLHGLKLVHAPFSFIFLFYMLQYSLRLQSTRDPFSRFFSQIIVKITPVPSVDVQREVRKKFPGTAEVFVLCCENALLFMLLCGHVLSPVELHKCCAVSEQNFKTFPLGLVKMQWFSPLQLFGFWRHDQWCPWKTLHEVKKRKSDKIGKQPSLRESNFYETRREDKWKKMLTVALYLPFPSWKEQPLEPLPSNPEHCRVTIHSHSSSCRKK